VIAAMSGMLILTTRSSPGSRSASLAKKLAPIGRASSLKSPRR
jgi:hypothetical protein